MDTPAYMALDAMDLNPTSVGVFIMGCYIILFAYGLAFLTKRSNLERVLAKAAFLCTWFIGLMYFVFVYIARTPYGSPDLFSYVQAGIQSWLVAFFIPIRVNALQRLTVPRGLIDASDSNFISLEGRQ